MKLRKGDVIEITISDNGQFLMKINGYPQYENDHEYMFKRCGITWQDAANTLKTKEKITINL